MMIWQWVVIIVICCASVCSALWQQISNMFLALKQVNVFLQMYEMGLSSFILFSPLFSSWAAPSLVLPWVIDYRAVIRQSNLVSATMNYSSHSTYPYEVNHCENDCNICRRTLHYAVAPQNYIQSSEYIAAVNPTSLHRVYFLGGLMRKFDIGVFLPLFLKLLLKHQSSEDTL